MYPRSNDFGRLQSLRSVLAAADVLGSDNGRWWASIAEFFRALGAAELGVSVAQYTYAFSHEALTQNVAPFVVRADAAAQSANRLTTIVDVVMQLHVDAHVAAAFTHPEIRLDEMLQSLAVVPMVAVHARSEVEALFLTHWR